MMLKLGLALGALVFGATAVSAEVVDCNYKTNETSYITDRYIFAYDAGNPAAVVIDGYIKYKLGKPMDAKLETKADKLVFIWKIQVEDMYHQKAMMYYRNTFDPKNMTAKISSVAGGVQGEAITFSASGKCEFIDEKTGKAKKSKSKN